MEFDVTGFERCYEYHGGRRRIGNKAVSISRHVDGMVKICSPELVADKSYSLYMRMSADKVDVVVKIDDAGECLARLMNKNMSKSPAIVSRKLNLPLNPGTRVVVPCESDGAGSIKFTLPALPEG